VKEERIVKATVLLVAITLLFACAAYGQATPSPSPAAKDKLDILTEKVDSLAKDEKADGLIRNGVPLMSLVVSIGALILTYKLTKGAWEEARRNAERTLQHQVKETEAKAIREKLDVFFGPLIQLRSTSNILYDALRGAQPNPENFRTLKAVLEGFQFDANSKMLVEEIIALGKLTEELIATKAGLIDEEIAEIVWKLQAHYRVLRLAYNGALKGEYDRFKDHVFPRGIDEALHAKASNLKARLKWLTSSADT
jgi:hypothetical protein